jgi:DNA-binding SARP family transcriptional activator
MTPGGVASMNFQRATPRQETTRKDWWFWLAPSLWILALIVVIWVVYETLSQDIGESGVGALSGVLVDLVGVLALVTIGALIGWLRPENPVGWLLLVDGLVWTLGVAHERYVFPDGLRQGADVAAAFFDYAGWVLGLGLIGLALLVFPTGRPLTQRWRMVGWMIVVGGGVLAVAGLMIPGELPSWPITNPFGVEPLGQVMALTAEVAQLVFTVGFLGALASVVVRFRRSSGIERQQLLWLAFAVGAVVVGFMVGDLLTALQLPGEAWANTLPLITAVPIAIGIAIFRHRLWDLDLVLDRTLTYGFVAVVITAIYILMIAGIGALVGGGAGSDVWLAVLATGMAAAIFQPAKEAAQSGVRHLVFRSKGADAVPEVRIRSFGSFRVELGGEPLSTSEWQSRKARQLLKILVARRGRPVHREQLMEVLWPGESPKGVKNRLAVAASTLRAVLDPGKAHPNDHYVKGDANALQLDLDHVVVDAEEFLAEAETGLRSGGAELEAAEKRYLGDFLVEDLYEEWAQPLREQARAAYLAVLRARAEVEQDRNPDVALTTLFKVIEVDPWDESAHLAIVSTLRETGRHGEARRAQRRYEAQMQELGIDPVTFNADPRRP